MFSLAVRAKTSPALKVTTALTTSFRRPIARTTRGSDPKAPPPEPSLIDNAPGWNEDLATPSEAFVKADRDTMAPTGVNEMQKKTVDYVRSHHPRNNNNGPDPLVDLTVERTHATYARDEVSGPLGSAGMGEFEGVVGDDDLGPDNEQIVESDGRVVTRRVAGQQGSGPGQNV